MVPAATLKAFEPLSAFDADERSYWERYASGGTVPPGDRVLLSRERGLRAATVTLVADAEHADLLERRGVLYVCPHRTRLRLLTAVLAFRQTVPADAVGAFLPPGEVERAAEELEALRRAHPRWRSHILESAWEVPLHWFVAFDDAEREVVEPVPGEPTIRYETVVRAARERLGRALTVIRGRLPNPAAVAAVGGLARWLEQFDASGLLVLDYGGVARLVPPDELRRDRTCREVWGAVAALARGDLERASAHYLVAAERWAGIRRRESWN
jgi:hypothetical protein